MKHTKGPWEVSQEPRYGGNCLVVIGDWKIKGFICEVQAPIVNDEFDLQTLKANARLIAAAPNLYEACKAAVQFIKNGVELGYIILPAKGDPALETLPMLEQAISKVEEKP